MMKKTLDGGDGAPVDVDESAEVEEPEQTKSTDHTSAPVVECVVVTSLQDMLTMSPVPARSIEAVSATQKRASTTTSDGAGAGAVSFVSSPPMRSTTTTLTRSSRRRPTRRRHRHNSSRVLWMGRWRGFSAERRMAPAAGCGCRRCGSSKPHYDDAGAQGGEVVVAVTSGRHQRCWLTH
uniref:Uncharacterized protein n=1 Tax=Arundo donax TaxID=35708 RepID=A0A0A8Z4R0_ARUDO